jgi:arylsulfatase A-like enzyme
MKDRPIYLTLAILALLNPLQAADVRKPNILLILADDMGYSDLGCYGSEISTPNLDSLAGKGVRFTRFYNSAKCEPTRASLMSGQYWQDCGFGVQRGITMGEAMKSADYDTFALGKWHLDGNPVERGFDHYFGHLSGGSHYFQTNTSHRLDAEPFTSKPEDKFYTTDANAEYAIKFIEEAHRKNPEKPFFTYLAFNAPHSPLQAWPEDIAKYKGKYRIGWDKLRELRYQKQLKLGITKKEWPLSPRQATIPAWDSLSDKEKDFEETRMAIYAAMVDRMDQAIGTVLAKIKALGEEQNTLVIFLSDNGGSPSDPSTADRTPEGLLGKSGAGRDGYWYGLGWANLSDTPFRSFKCDMGNGGMATSCIASWPAVVKNPGSIVDQSSHIIDLMATIVDVGGVSWPAKHAGKKIASLPGKSLRPLLAGQSRAAHEALYFQLFHNRAIIQGDLKLVSDWDQPWQLYNLATDRTELNDLAKSEPEKAARMQKQWEDWHANVSEKRYTPGSGEPIYRSQADDSEKFQPRKGISGESGEKAKPKSRNKKNAGAS